MSMFYDRLGVPIDLWEWASLMEDPSYRIIAQTTVGNYQVSTVWIGIDYAFLGGPPLIYETVVFGQGAIGALDDDEMMIRYSNEGDARNGHEQVVQMIQVAERTTERVDW